LLALYHQQRKGKKKTGAEDGEEEDGDDEEVSTKKKTRIRINVQSNKDEDASTGKKKGKKKGGKRKSGVDDEEIEAEDADAEATPVAPKKKRKKSAGQSKKKSTKKDQDKSVPTGEAEADDPVEENGTAENESPAPNYLDTSWWKKERENLDGKAFSVARAHLTKYGPWELPEAVSTSKFADVAKATMAKMNKHDRYSVFAEAVTDADAPGYSDVVKNPMDFGTMMKKVEDRDYGRGDAAAAGLYEDFVLVFDNCLLYNPDDSEVGEEAARILSLLPEAFAAACAAAAKKK
jgi:hypothetical protein